MSLKDEIRTKLRTTNGAGWKELVQGKPEARDALIELVGQAIAEGRNPRTIRALDLVLRRKQHLNDLDLLFILGAV